MKTMIPELLSPVGGRVQLEAAINNGADAVYMGGSLFNARINAENFTEDTLAEAIDYAHESGVKVYITFNTLIKDSELARAFRYACRLYEMGADALILQDMGLARLVHKYLPDFPIHLSTQGTVYNVQALDLVKQLGFSRVVPARELSLEEISRFTAKCHELEMDTEVFVHGALCMCYSGQCQMSRAFGGGGRSGNRGLCAQPCRLLYMDDKRRKGYFLSPKDLCTLELLPQLIEAGVDSFKIEGRLKSAEYVAVTTAVYRKYLDQYAEVATEEIITPDAWKEMIDPADMAKLRQVFNRGGFTTGYLEGNPGQKILSGSSPKNQGIYIGTVSTVRPVKGSRDKVLADVRLQSDNIVAQGDGVEIRRTAEETGSSIATYTKTLADGTLRIGDFDRAVKAGDKAYKVTDKTLREEAVSRPTKRLPSSMRFEAHVWQKPELEIRWQEDTVHITGDTEAEEARIKPTDESKIRGQLMKLGDTRFRADEADIEVEVDPQIMLPVSVINQMRRQAAEALADILRTKVTSVRKPLAEGVIQEIIKTEQLGNEDAVQRVENLKADADLPFILNVSKGELDEYIEENFNDIVGKVSDTGILIGNLGWIKQFQDAGVTVYGDYGLNAYNSQAVKAYEELDVKMLHLSHERRTDGRSGDARFGGRIPLMITEHPFDTDYLIDRKGVKHEILKYGDKQIVL
ncbi:MAG: U32 family peptidase [Clostridiales bacterium]|nr:U32 family peptidase [Clostridiales bacterium]